MAPTAADILLDTIQDWGVEVIFGLPGDGINGIIESLRKREKQIRFIQVRHEESAAFMACAYAKYTGKLGVCLATSGPGGIHLLNGLYDAKLDGQPVLAITGHHFHDLIDTHAQQDVSLDRLFADVAVYNTRVMSPNHVENVADLACRTALGYRGVAHINFPVDLQEQTGGERSKRNIPAHTSHTQGRSARMPADADVARAADVLNAGKRIAILCGQGALHATDQLEKVAAILGCADHQSAARQSRGAGRQPLHYRRHRSARHQAFAGSYGKLRYATDGRHLVSLYRISSQAGAGAGSTDRSRPGAHRFALSRGSRPGRRQQRDAHGAVAISRAQRRSQFSRTSSDGHEKWWSLMEELGTRKDKPMKPQVVAWELGRRIAGDAIVSSDSGTIATWFARQMPVRRGQMYSLSGTLASMANGLPYAIAAQIAYPHRQCIAFVGDGGFSMLMAEFATAVKYQLPIKVFIIKNNTLGMIKWEQMVFLGNPEYGCELQPIDFAAFAQACGGTGMTVEDPEQCGPVIDRGLGGQGPVIVEAVVDPFVPPMPAKITLEQAAHFAQSLARGEPNRS